MSWKVYTILAMLLCFFINLTIKKVTLLRDYRPELMIAWMAAFISLSMLVICRARGYSIVPECRSLPWIALLALLQGVFWTAYWAGIRTSPNPGYVAAIISANAILVVIASSVVFKSAFSVAHITGAVLVTIGICLILIF